MANNLLTEKKIVPVAMLGEGNSIVHRDTIMRLGVRVGEGCKTIMDDKFRDLNCDLIEVDEVWGFIGMKQKTANACLAPMQYGDVWTWIALDAKSKLVPTFAVGDRSAQMANLFMDDLAARLPIGCKLPPMPWRPNLARLSGPLARKWITVRL